LVTEHSRRVPAGAFEPDALMADVRRLTELGWKRNGSPAAARAAGLFRDEFEAHCLSSVVESWPYNAYYPQEWAVAVEEPTPWSAGSLPIWYSAPGQGVGELVYVDAREAAPSPAGLDVTGKVLLVDVSYRGNFLPSDASSTVDSGLYAAAVQEGAIGYLRRSGAPANAPSLMHFAQNFPTHTRDAEYGPIPAFTVGADDFDRLRNATSERTVSVRFNLELCDVPKGGERVVEGGSLGPGRHRLRGLIDDVVGTLPGVSSQTIVVASHYDTTFDGAVDNATGNAVLLALMRHYARQPLAARAKTLVFLASGGHDTGDFDLYHFAERHANDILRRTVAFNWLDHMAADDSCSPPGRPIAHGLIAAENDRLRRIISGAMSAHEIPVEPAWPPLSSISHLPNYLPSYNVTLAPAWYHSIHDTLETVPLEQLARMAWAQFELLERLMQTDGALLRAENPDALPLADLH
jgi:hypothetical protein